MKKILKRLNPRSVRVLEQHGTRPAYRREQPSSRDVVTIGGIAFRPR